MSAARADNNWCDDQTFNLLPTPVLEEPGYLVNVRLTYASGSENWRASVFVENLSDHCYWFHSVDTSSDSAALKTYPVRRVGLAQGFHTNA